MEVSSTYYFTMCECGDVGRFDNTSSGIINQKLYYQSYCLNGTQLRRRDDACDPDCISCMFARKAGDLTGSAVIAAAVISAVVTGVLTAVLVGICCRKKNKNTFLCREMLTRGSVFCLFEIKKKFNKKNIFLNQISRSFSEIKELS